MEHNKWTLSALQDELKDRGFSGLFRGNKAELVQSLEDDDVKIVAEPEAGEGSARRKRKRESGDILGQLECPCCTYFMLPPFVQCDNGTHIRAASAVICRA